MAQKSHTFWGLIVVITIVLSDYHFPLSLDIDISKIKTDSITVIGCFNIHWKNVIAVVLLPVKFKKVFSKDFNF